MLPEEPLTIGKIADATGTKVETVRYYERIGLLPPPRRTGGNYRSYDANHLNRLAFIRRSRDLGFTIEQIKELLGLADQKERSCSAVDALARQHLGEVERKIADLNRLAQELRHLSKQCQGGTIAECRILDALSPEPRPSPVGRASAAFAFLLTGFVLFAAQAASAAPGDPEHGARAFRVCSACHSLAPGRHRTGPSLAGIFGRKAGTAEGFRRYSPALKAADIVWNETTLDAWIADPQAVIPGNRMTYDGLADAQARADLIAYLAQAQQQEAASQGGMMDMGAAEMPNLKAVGPAEQVTAIRHCGDTYDVTNGRGETASVWEFNLRFKTDGSEFGPEPGKPVMVGAGMMGDRASIVFAAPKEISTFIQEECR
jgi:cytochrome c